jgi:mannose-6-phosphate isomerase-like protein (cupin superfamily)
MTEIGVVLLPDEGRRIFTAGTGSTAVSESIVKATAADTRGAYALQQRVVPAGQPWVQPHIHHATEEGFYVLEGEMAFRLNDRIVDHAGAGSFILVPRGVPHTFANPGRRQARALLFFSPPGLEGFFEELAELRRAGVDGHVEAAAISALAAKYDTVYLSPTDGR